MKKFLLGFLHKFLVLSLLVLGIRMWQSGPLWLAMALIALSGTVLIGWYWWWRKGPANE